jgi:autoinducer 2-binding protein LuxP
MITFNNIYMTLSIRTHILPTSLILSLLYSASLLSQPTLTSSTYWLPEEVNEPLAATAFQHLVSLPAQRISTTSKTAIRIALIYPSNDVSDFWKRNYIALTARLTELNIPFTTKEFPSKQIEHALQTQHTEEVFQNSRDYDFVIFGPSELTTQSSNIEKLASTTDFTTLIWAFHTPIKASKFQPKAWFDFSSSTGSKAICEYLIGRLGNNVNVVLNRGIPGVTDDQRSGEFKNCVKENGKWNVLYEHFGQYQEYGGQDGANYVTQHFPKTQVLHNANTAMTIGSVKELEAQGASEHIFVTGWGGTKKELELIRQGRLNATPMRLSDDVGVATAEAIKLLIENRAKEIPTVYLGRITVAHDKMTDPELDALADKAFRYSK